MPVRSSLFLAVTIFMTALTSSFATAEVTNPDEPDAAAVIADPEWIDWGDLHHVAPTHIYFLPRQDTDTSGCKQAPDSYVFGRVIHGGGVHQKEQFLFGCDAPQATWIVINTTHLYRIYNELGSHTLLRRSDNGLPPDEILAKAVQPEALALDANYVYYATGGSQSPSQRGIWRININGNTTPEMIVALPELFGSTINRLHVDDTHIYWTEGDETTSAVRAANKNGGAWAGIASTGVVGAQDIATDKDYVYWSEMGGRIMRHPKNGGGGSKLLHQAEFPVRHIDVAEGFLVFTVGTAADGSIWRVPSSGGTADPLVSNQHAPGPISIVAGNIYWNATALKRIPLDTDPIRLDYKINWVEVTQAIQNRNNDVPLIAHHATSLRVYAFELDGTSPAPVRAALTARGTNGTPLDGSPLISAAQDVPKNGPKRADGNLTFNFVLPEGWIHEGELTMEVEINPLWNGQQAFETKKNNNLYKVEKVEFVTNDFCVVTYPIAAVTVFEGVQLIAEATDLYYAHYERAESMMPGPLAIAPTGVELWNEEGEAFDMSVGTDREEVKALMEDLAAFGDNPYACGEIFTGVQGLAHPNTKKGINAEGGPLGGQGFNNPPVSWSVTSASGSAEDGYTKPDAGWLLAHEMTHATGNGHIGCKVTPQDCSYPYPVCQLDVSDDEIRHWGFDIITNTAISPLVARDYRTYEKPKWVSDYTWKNVANLGPGSTACPQNNSNSTGSLAQPFFVNSMTSPQRDPYEGPLLVVRTNTGNTSSSDSALFLNEPIRTASHQDAILSTAVIDESANASEMALQLLESNEELQGKSSDFAILLRSARGSLLYTQPIVPGEPNESEEPGVPGVTIYSDMSVMRFDASTKFIQLVDRNTNQVLDEVEISSSAPEVVDVQTAIKRDNLVVTWDGRDADRDKLTYMVRYSFDDGDTWSARQTHIDTEMVTLSLGSALPAFPGSDTARVEITANDGTLTGSAISRPFKMPKNKPLAVIVSPSTDKTITEGEALLAIARGFDLEDGPLRGRSLTWTLDGKTVGNGRWLQLTEMTPGRHSVQLTVLDNDGNRTTDSFRVQVNKLPGAHPPDSGSGNNVLLPLIVGM